MKKTVIFFDIDGTLVDASTGMVPESTKQALQKLKEAGHTLCIATGRGMRSLQNAKFDQLINWDAYVCNTGQMIYDHNKNLLFEKYIDQKAVQETLAFAKKEKLVLLLESIDHAILTDEVNDYVIKTYEYIHEPIEPVGTYDGFPVIMMMCFAPIEYDYTKFNSIKGIRAIPGMSTFADIVIDDYSKEKGIQELLKHLHETEYICFGDSLNDIEMAKHAHYSIAMGNAHEELKKVCNYITDDIHQNGIYNACIKLKLFK